MPNISLCLESDMTYSLIDCDIIVRLQILKQLKFS